MSGPQAEDAFRTFVVDSPHAIRTLRKELLTIKETVAESVVGGCATDWADYWRRVGKITGINAALEICDDMEKQERQ